MKFYFSFICLFILSFSELKADHVMGGELRWDCLSNGRFRFYLTVYRDCTGIPYKYNDEILDLHPNDSKYPYDEFGLPLQSILLKPDSNRWLNERNGDTSPECSGQYGSPNSCSNEDPGTMQQFFYKSAPIIIDGIPPKIDGWEFSWTARCCRPNDLKNVYAQGKTMLLRAIMYRTKNRDKTYPCLDSSPKFEALPTTMVCRGQRFTYNSVVIDPDLDSVVFSWDQPYNPGIPPSPLVYKSRYSSKNPTPDASFHKDNIPSTMNRTTGTVVMEVHNGGGTEKFITVHRADSYRDGVVIASVFREIPVSVFDCDRLPNNQINTPPQVKLNGKNVNDVKIRTIAGQRLVVGVQVKDSNLTGIGTQLQQVTVVPGGLMFSKTKASDLPCQITYGRGQNMVVEPCAYLRKKTPFYDKNAIPPEYKIQAFGSITTKFIWQTDCRHIQTKTGTPGSLEGLYRFVLRVSDDHCPVPALNYATITVKVNDPLPILAPIMKGASVGLDGKVTYQWAPPLDSSTTFDHYIVESAAPGDGVKPSIFNVLNPGINLYQSSKENQQYFVHFPKPPPSSGFNILRKIPNKDWYFRMTTASGCSDSVLSSPSESVRIIEPDIVLNGQAPFPIRSSVRLSWNRPKPVNAKSYGYPYESKTHFYIWENDSILNGGASLASNWYLRGDTVGSTTYELKTNVCGEYVGFRVEARDTIRMPVQGTAFEDSLQTITYSTFSLIDTVYMRDDGFLPKPKLDTIRVEANGDIYVRVDRGNAGTAGTFNFYENNLSGNLLKSIQNGVQDSALINNQNANISSKAFVLESIDKCNANNVKASDVYTTILVDGNLKTPICAANYELSWNKPSGFPKGIKGYRIYVDTSGNQMELIAQISNPNQTSYLTKVFKSIEYDFRVLAFDEEGAVNISSTHSYTPADSLRTFEIVPSPDLRCTAVNLDGSVWVSFLSPGDSTKNGLDYEVDYRVTGGSWVNYINKNDNKGLFYNQNIGVQVLDSFLIAGINAQQDGYEIRVRTRSGCEGNDFSSYSTIHTINLVANALPNDIQKRVELDWTTTGVDYGLQSNPPLSAYIVYKDPIISPYTGINLIGLDVRTLSYNDQSNGEVCDDNFSYFVQLTDPVSGCRVLSNLDSAHVLDKVPPASQKLKSISYNHLGKGNGDLFVRWDNSSITQNPGDVARLNFFTVDEPYQTKSNYQRVASVAWDTLAPIGHFTISQQLLDATNNAVYLGVQSQDACGAVSALEAIPFHQSMHISSQWNSCDSVFELEWNPYLGYDSEYEVVYELFVDTNASDASMLFISTGLRTQQHQLNYKPLKGNRNHAFYVRAESGKTQDKIYPSNSNVAYDSVLYGAVPSYGYIYNTTVNENNQIELTFMKDTTVSIGGFEILKGENASQMYPLQQYSNDYQPDPAIQFLDAQVQTEARSYFYQVVTYNPCGAEVQLSNISRSMHLQVRTEQEALRNRLQWNAQEGWDSTVQYYNIYRGIDALPTQQVYKRLAPSSNGINVFLDDVYDDAVAVGKFCYRIEAVQGKVNPFTDQQTSQFQAAKAYSNIVCTEVAPLFYVPNAFAPNGVNTKFGPKGQFFNYNRYEMLIYNRWGEQVYRSRDINQGWNGNWNGKPAPAGSYIYTIRFVDSNNKEHLRKGSFSLVR